MAIEEITDIIPIEQTRAVAQIPDLKPMSVQQVVGQVQLIHEIMSAVMTDKVHFGTIPGCGDKPTLFKAGAEKLCLAFHFRPRYKVETSREDGHIRHTVTTSLYNPAGEFMGEGVGECSTAEEKYAWRKVWDEEWNATALEMRRIKSGKYPTKQVRTNVADVANTVLKMAKKRSLVDATLTACAASDILTQDLEDIPAEYRGQHPEDLPRHTQPAAPAIPMITADQTKTIRESVDGVVITNDWVIGQLAAIGLKKLSGLTYAQAETFIAKMAEAIDAAGKGE